MEHTESAAVTPAPAKSESEAAQPETAASESQGSQPTYEIVVNGETRRVTLDEMRKLAEKAAGADQRFREAAELRKQAARIEHIANLVDAAREDRLDEDGWNELNALLGIPDLTSSENPDNLETEDEEESESETETDRKTSRPRGKGAPRMTEAEAAPKRQVSLQDLAPEVRAQFEAISQQAVEQRRRAIENEIMQAIDKDAELGKIVGKDQEAKRAAFELVFGDVQRRVLVEQAPYGPETVEAALQKARALVARFSKPAAQADKPGKQTPGLGAAPSAPDAHQVSKPPERVPISDPDYIRNLHTRALALQSKLMSESGE